MSSALFVLTTQLLLKLEKISSSPTSTAGHHYNIILHTAFITRARNIVEKTLSRCEGLASVGKFFQLTILENESNQINTSGVDFGSKDHLCLAPSVAGRRHRTALPRLITLFTAVSFPQSLSQRYQTQISSAVRGENVGRGAGRVWAGPGRCGRGQDSFRTRLTAVFRLSSAPDEVSRVLPSLVMVDRASPRPKVAAHVTGSFPPKLEQDAGGEGGAGGGGESRRTSG